MSGSITATGVSAVDPHAIPTAISPAGLLQVRDDTQNTPVSGLFAVVSPNSGLGRVALRSSAAIFLTAGSSNGITLQTFGNAGGTIDGITQFAVSHTASAVNYINATGAATGNAPTFSAAGNDTNVNLNLAPKGTGIVGVLGANNNLALSGSSTGNAVSIGVAGSDADISLNVSAKGLGGIRFLTGPASNLSQLFVSHVANAVNYVQIAGGSTGNPASVLAAGTDTDIALALRPKGAGGLIAAFPDGTSAGGNGRGNQAVDWQIIRTANTQVASGAQSVVGGGSQNTASGVQSVVAGGLSGTASSTNATVGGGYSNTASAIESTSAGGRNNTVSGRAATVSGGTQSTASGINSWVPGGANAFTRGLTGRGAWASGQFAAAGDAQAGETVLRRRTVDATATELTSDALGGSTTNQFVLPDTSAAMVRYLVIAKTTGANDYAAWEGSTFVIRGVGVANTFLPNGTIGPVAPVGSAGTGSNARLTVQADTTNGAVQFIGTGEAAKTYSWVARIISVEVVA